MFYPDTLATSSSSLQIDIDPYFVSVRTNLDRSFLFKTAVKYGNISRAVVTALEMSSTANGFSHPDKLLKETTMIRISTNVGEATILSGRGEPVGLIVSDSLSEAANQILLSLGLSTDFLSVYSEVNSLSPEPIRKVVSRFLNHGARSIGICLQTSDDDRTREQELRESILRQYPPHFIGSVPILLSSCDKQISGQLERLEAVAVDGYVRTALAHHLCEIRLVLQQNGYNGTILVDAGHGEYVPIQDLRPWLAVRAVYHSLVEQTQWWLGQENLPRGIALRIGSMKSDIALMGGKKASRSGKWMKERLLGGWMSVVQRKNDRFTLVPSQMRAEAGWDDVHWGGRAPTLADILLAIGLLGCNNSCIHDEMDISTARDVLNGLTGSHSDNLNSSILRAYHDIADDLATAVRRHLQEHGLSPDHTPLLLLGQVGGLLAVAVAERLGYREVHALLGDGAFPFDRLHPDQRTRSVFWSSTLGWHDCPVIWEAELEAGAEQCGPLLIEGVEGEYWVPPGWTFVKGHNRTARWIRRS